ncbi:MAG: thiamine pyrophosphate-binding protein [Sulfuricella sp.]|nr:thiamine pyrophosphate-binding protein [Sulfuricella sp.]
MKIAVRELIVRYLERLGIEVIFGMPGAHILPVYDSLYDSNIKSVLVKHEQGAAFMAGGYARASGRISACITTAGPGATNLVTGIANAYADKQPILIITGETSTHIFGKGGLQESSGEGGSIDQAALFKGITKYNKIIERTDYLVHVLNQASKILLSSNSGPVLLSFPYNVQKEMVEENLLDRVHTRNSSHSLHKRALPVDALTELIAEAKYPVIVAGYGCIKSGAQEVVAQLSEAMNIPVTTTLKGKGVIGDGSGLSLGSLGVTSNGAAYKYIVDHADLVLFLGAGFNERTSYLWDDKLLGNKKIAQIDNDHDQLEKVFKADVAIHGDIKDALTEILERIGDIGATRKNLDKFHVHAEGLSKEASSKDDSVLPSRFALVKQFYSKLETHFPENALIFDDNIIFAQNFFNVSSGNRYFPNSGISSLGHAIPAAIGARFSEQKPTFAILGDGGFQMCCMEIMTAVNYGIPLNVVVFNNSTMSLIRKNQFQLYDKRFIDCDFVNPDFRYLALSFGINHKKIVAESDLDDLFANSDLENAINLIEIMIDKDAFPNYLSGR